ncbi:MAG: hypothetical protein U5L96_14415 [Owenweeksia sp.]|nr:hypothetical protein [Owenweeksia sp.]
MQLIYTMRLSQSSEYLFSRQLGKTSILTSDRSVLFDLFEREGEELPAAEPTPDKDLLAARLEKNLEPTNADNAEEQPTASESRSIPARKRRNPQAEAPEPTQEARVLTSTSRRRKACSRDAK